MLLAVKVKTGSRKDSVVQVGKVLQISVRDKPRENRANEKVCALIARHFNIPGSRVRMIRGHRTKSKLLELHNL